MFSLLIADGTCGNSYGGDISIVAEHRVGIIGGGVRPKCLSFHFGTFASILRSKNQDGKLCQEVKDNQFSS